MAVKVYGVRIEEHVIKDFKKALDSLPVVLKSGRVIEAYMLYITESIKEYHKTGEIGIQLNAGGHDFLFMKEEGENYIIVNGKASKVINEEC